MLCPPTSSTPPLTSRKVLSLVYGLKTRSQPAGLGHGPCIEMPLSRKKSGRTEYGCWAGRRPGDGSGEQGTSTAG